MRLCFHGCISNYDRLPEGQSCILPLLTLHIPNVPLYSSHDRTAERQIGKYIFKTRYIHLLCLLSGFVLVVYFSAREMDWSGKPGGEEEVKVAVAFLGVART